MKLLLAFVFVVFLTGCDSSENPNEDPVSNNENVAEKEIQETQQPHDSQTEEYEFDDVKFIDGISPVDVYLNMDDQGFETEKKIGTELGNFWTSKLEDDGVTYIVEVFSKDVSKVESIRATSMVNASVKKIEAAKMFMQFVSSIPYRGSEPDVAAKWVNDNFNRDKATTTIGGVTFVLYAPSRFARMLEIEVQ